MMADKTSNLASLVRSTLSKHGITMTEFLHRYNIPRSTLYHWIRGDVRIDDPPYKLIAALADLEGVSPAEIFARIDGDCSNFGTDAE